MKLGANCLRRGWKRPDMLRSVFALLVLSFGLTACMPDILGTKPEVKGLKSTAKTETLYNPETGTRVTLRAGDILIVTLKGNVTTGYFWSTYGGWDETILADFGNEYFNDPNPQQMSGVGGRREFTFRALKPGEVKLVFSHSRDPDKLEFEKEVFVTVTE